MKNAAKLIISILLCQTAGLVGSFFTRQSVNTWYLNIKKPFFNPPNFVFAPVWITLYALMGIALFMIWRRGPVSPVVRKAFYVFVFQLFINSFWSFAFFGCRSPLAGLIVIVILWLAILWAIIIFFRISRMASMLLIPYILWVSFAVLLNGAILFLNK